MMFLFFPRSLNNPLLSIFLKTAAEGEVEVDPVDQPVVVDVDETDLSSHNPRLHPQRPEQVEDLSTS